ncbi:MAG TPA: GntR family transcriptional regulator [Firmicutes bacterium]|nr:GntR family transcriptional regulator [Bacillota bacterium]
MGDPAETMEYNQKSPIYLQIMDYVKMQLVSGAWKAGQRVLPVRELAAGFGVNPNTMQRALAELEREGLMYTERTAGRFITKDEALIAAVRRDTAEKILDEFIGQMQKIGYSDQQIVALVEKRIEQ